MMAVVKINNTSPMGTNPNSNRFPEKYPASEQPIPTPKPTRPISSDTLNSVRSAVLAPFDSDGSLTAEGEMGVEPVAGGTFDSSDFCEVATSDSSSSGSVVAGAVASGCLAFSTAGGAGAALPVPVAAPFATFAGAVA